MSEEQPIDGSVLAHKIIGKYKDVAVPMLSRSFSDLDIGLIEEAVDYSITKRAKDPQVILENNYKGKKLNTSLLTMADYILEREPIITAHGVLFKKHDQEDNPIALLMKTFMEERGIFKDKMFEYPKGSAMYEKYNLNQLLSKIDANALYGGSGSNRCIYYNIHAAASTTAQGRYSVSLSAMCFESFLANNVKFRSLDEVIEFIDNILKEERIFNDKNILDHNIPIESVLEHILDTCGHGYIPELTDIEKIWDILQTVTQEDLNRLFYKNNLFAFMDNDTMTESIIYILQKLDVPYLNPNKPPEIIVPEMDALWDIVREYVFYNYGYVDIEQRTKLLPRAVTLLLDTDSNVVLLDPWYKYILDKIYHIPMKIKTELIERLDELETDELGNIIYPKAMYDIEQKLDYNFYTDEVIELESLASPLSIIPQDGLRYSIINIMSFMLDKIMEEAMLRYTKSAYSYRGDDKCLMIMKNEYLFKSMLISEGRKMYATILELQEGHKVGGKLDIKGLAMDKSTLNDRCRERFRKIISEDILKNDNIDQMKVLKELAILEKEIYRSLKSGSKEYYKPLSVKSMSAYDNPMSQQGITASYAWNELKDSWEEGLDLNSRNNIDIVKVDINPRNVEKLKEISEEKYNTVLELFKEKAYSRGIRSIAIPLGVETPEWVIEFIDYVTIINDNITAFKRPLESIGIEMFGRNNINYTNILKL